MKSLFLNADRSRCRCIMIGNELLQSGELEDVGRRGERWGMGSGYMTNKIDMTAAN